MSRSSHTYDRSDETPQDVSGRRSILHEIDREYFDLLNRMFYRDECIVFPNVALQSIFAYEQIKHLETWEERNLYAKGIVDFCVFGAVDFRPKVAFNINKDELQSRVFDFFGLPLLHLRSHADI
jgi:hypothetical protein